jgi:two-component system, OmpR family, response regulator ArlR
VAKILVVEDDAETIEAIRSVLEHERHAVDCANSADLGWDFARMYEYDLMIFDWEMPGMTGVELLRKLRAAGSTTPVVMLTGRSGTSNIVSGLDSGADNYLTKPFDGDVLLSVVRANLRRKPQSEVSGIKCEDLELFPDAASVSCGGKQCSLTNREVVALKLLFENASRIITHDELRLTVYPDNIDISPTALRMFLSNLREKLSSIGSRIQLINVRGYGYQLRF